MTPSRPLVAAIVALGVWLSLLAPPARALTKIEGEYQLMLDVRKYLLHRPYVWDFDSNNNDNGDYLQLRLFSQPRTGVEAFFRVDADWHSFKNNSSRPVLQFGESHLRFRWDRPRLGGVDAYLFARQDRFWVDNYLLRIVDSGDDFRAPLRNANWGPNAQGVRVDSWGFLGFSSSWILSDFSGQFPFQRPVGRTDDAFVGRVRREMLGRRLRLGATYVRVEQERADPLGGSTPIPDGPAVLAFDSRFNVLGTDVSIEYAESRTAASATDLPYPQGLRRPVTLFGRSTGIELPERSVLVGELRSIRVGAPRIGYLNVAPLFWRRGALWEDPAGDNSYNGEAKNDESGYNLNAWYLLPERAITLTTNYRRYWREARERRETWELYNELYIEFVNGFTGKTYYRIYELERLPDFGRPTTDRYETWFGEVQVESRLAWFRIQTKFKDIGHPFRKQLFSAETRINLTDKLKNYNRYVFANDPIGLRKAIFMQLQYYPSPNVLMFLEYGPNWIGDAGTPVDDGDLEGGGFHVDMVKFILKGTF
jgi:hypothetical protein